MKRSILALLLAVVMLAGLAVITAPEAKAATPHTEGRLFYGTSKGVLGTDRRGLLHFGHPSEGIFCCA